jgi:hypothetical protein
VLAADAATFPGDLRPQVAANALIGVHRALLDHVRRRSQSGEVLAGLADEVRKLAADAFGVLEQGLCNYAAKQANRDLQTICPSDSRFRHSHLP